MAKIRLTYDTPEVQAILDSVAGKADIKTGTTEWWNAQTGYVPPQGELIVYLDARSKVVDGETVYIPGLKIGGGNAYVQDLAFLDEGVSDALIAHIGDTVAHVTAEERNFWNRKINVADLAETEGETLVFNRN